MEDSGGLIDRSEMIEHMKAELRVEAERCAVVTIDCQRGNLDPEIATLPVPDQDVRRIVAGINRLTARARQVGVPIIHMETVYEDSLRGAHPFEQAMLNAKQSFTPDRQSRFGDHKSPGSPGAELIPQMDVMPDDYRVGSKRTFDMFYGTQLEILLRSLSVDTLLVGGCNTNTCVLASVYGAYVRNLKVVVVSDCVASAYGEDLHAFALSNIQRRLGWVLTLDELHDKLGVARNSTRSS